MALTTVGCLSAQVLFPTQSWPAGSRLIGPLSLPDKFGYGWLLIDVSQLTDLTASVDTVVEMSFDGGQNWLNVGGWGLSLPDSGYTLDAGVLMVGTEPVRITGQSLRLPSRASLTRQIRATVTLSRPAVIGMTVAIW